MANTSTMDYEAIQKISNQFGSLSDKFKKVAKVLQAAILILKASAFVGTFGSAALERYLSGILPHMNRLAGTTSEMAGDLAKAIAERKEADEAIAAEARKA
jgi:uncharacterized protein YukE